MFQRIFAIGPGAIVAAAFIGPGTLTVATTAGGNFGCHLLWAVAFSTFACIVLQEMSVRLGVAGRLGVGEAIRQRSGSPLIKVILVTIALAAVLIGNAAFEGGNISGGLAGVQLAMGDVQNNQTRFIHVQPIVVALIAGITFGLLWFAQYKLVEKVLVGLVVTMGVTFLTTATMVQPDLNQIVSGLCWPSFPAGSGLTVVALIGTTVVPYNLFLHASTARERWQSAADMTAARWDTYLSIIGGGVITASILITATASLSGGPDVSPGAVAGLGQMQSMPEILNTTAEKIGGWFKWLMVVGFLAAGISSAITAPLAAAYAAAELFNWPKEISDFRFRMVWISVLACGTLFAFNATSPQQMIVFAQIANGLLLPMVACFLIWVTNDKQLLGENKNSVIANGIGGVVVLVTIGLGVFGILKAFKLLGQ